MPTAGIEILRPFCADRRPGFSCKRGTRKTRQMASDASIIHVSRLDAATRQLATAISAQRFRRANRPTFYYLAMGVGFGSIAARRICNLTNALHSLGMYLSTVSLV
jgi:hypothetical protein